MISAQFILKFSNAALFLRPLSLIYLVTSARSEAISSRKAEISSSKQLIFVKETTFTILYYLMTGMYIFITFLNKV